MLRSQSPRSLICLKFSRRPRSGTESERSQNARVTIKSSWAHRPLQSPCLQKEAVDREECLQAIIASVLGGSCDETSTPDGGAGAVLVAFNLFALEAWHIAEALGARCCFLLFSQLGFRALDSS